MIVGKDCFVHMAKTGFGHNLLFGLGITVAEAVGLTTACLGRIVRGFAVADRTDFAGNSDYFAAAADSPAADIVLVWPVLGMGYRN